MPMIPLGQIAEVKLGKMLDKSKHTTGRKFPYLRNINVRWGRVDTSDLSEMFFKESEAERFSVNPGDVLVCEGGEPGRAAVWKGDHTHLKYQKALHRVRFHHEYDPRLLVYYLELLASRGALESRFTGSTIKHFTREAFIQLPVPNPPLPEQRRLVARIEELFSRLDAGVAALRHAKAQLQRYRQSVLAAAVTGQLSQAWREQHPDTEPGEILLERILKQRREHWNGRGRYKEPSETASVFDDEFPNGWTCASLDQLSTLVTDGDHNPPKRESSGIPHLTAKHIKKGTISMDKCTFVSEEGFDKTRSRYEPEADDVIVTCVGTIGEVALVPSGIVFSADRNLAAARLVRSGALPRFITCVLTSPKVAKFLREGSGSTAQPHLYLGDLRKTPIPLPPIAEQHQIVAEVEARTTAIDHLEAELDRQITRSNRLRQSTFRSAFLGQL